MCFWLVPGIVPWFFYSEALNCITGCLQEYSYLVKKVVFQVEILPVIKLISCLLVHGFFLLIMLIMALCFGRLPMATWIQILYYSFAASMLALAFGYLTSAIHVFFKDMAQIVSICLQFGMWLSPIMYQETMFSTDYPWIVTVLKLNPFYYIVGRIPGQYSDRKLVLGASNPDRVFLGGNSCDRICRFEGV